MYPGTCGHFPDRYNNPMQQPQPYGILPIARDPMTGNNLPNVEPNVPFFPPGQEQPAQNPIPMHMRQPGMSHQAPQQFQHPQSLMQPGMSQQENSQEIANLKNEIESLRRENLQLKEQLESKEKEIEEKDNEIEELKAQIEVLMPLEADENDKTFTTITAQQTIQPSMNPMKSPKGQMNPNNIKPLNQPGVQPKIVNLPQPQLPQAQVNPNGNPQVIPKLPEQKLGTDESLFTVANLRDNFGEWAGKMFLSSAGINATEIKQLYTTAPQQRRFDNLNLQKVLDENPTAVILFKIEDNVFAIKGSKKYSDASKTGGLLEDPEFEVFVLMQKGVFKKGCSLKPKENKGYDFSDKTVLLIVFNLFTINKTMKCIPSDEFFDEGEMEDCFDINGDCIPLIEKQKGRRNEFTIDNFDIITYK